MAERPGGMVVRPTLAGMDALSSLLDGPRGRGAFLVRCTMEPPWSVRIDDGAPLGLVAVMQGSGSISADSYGPRMLRPGSVGLMKGNVPVQLADDPGTPATFIFGPGGHITTPDGVEADPGMRHGARSWGNDPDGSTLMLLGCYQLRGEVSRRVLDALPGQLVLEPGTWNAALVRVLEEEMHNDEPGQQALLDRLFDVLLTCVVRAWFRQPEAQVPGWYSAESDPVVGKALRLLQEHPDHPWTIAGLAAETNLSRSALARRFTDRVGVAPMTYLREWRLARAADLLLDPDATLDAIARRVGYSDGSALSTVFKHARGVSPQRYRESGDSASIT